MRYGKWGGLGCVLTNRLSLQLRCGQFSKTCIFPSQYFYMGSRKKSEKVVGEAERAYCIKAFVSINAPRLAFTSTTPFFINGIVSPFKMWCVLSSNGQCRLTISLSRSRACSVSTYVIPYSAAILTLG